MLAGISEEITWRGVQTALLSNLTGHLWIAAIICSISFGLAHSIQGWTSSTIIVFFALGFHALVWLSGSLYVAMAVHVVAYDITAASVMGGWGRNSAILPSSTSPLLPPEIIAGECSRFSTFR